MIEGPATREQALRRYHTFSARHGWKFASMLATQRLVPRVPPRALGLALRAMASQRFVDWSFGHYLAIAPPSFASAPAAPSRSDRAAA